MNYTKAEEEVWAWRETVTKELQNGPREKRTRHLNKTALAASKKLGSKCRVLPPRTRVKEHA